MKKDFIDSNIIFENKFSKDIIKLSEVFIKKDKLEEKEDFILKVFKRIVEINKKFDDINYSYLHILNYPENEDYRKIFTIQNYTNYHIEIYMIKIISLFDRILHLVNLLYNLNLKGTGLNLENIKKKDKVDSNIIKTLEDFSSKAFELKNEQNYIKHEGSLDLPELEKIGMYEFLLIHSKDLDEKFKKSMKNFVESEFKKFKLNYKDKMLENTDGIAKFINKILDELYSIFINRLKLF